MASQLALIAEKVKPGGKVVTTTFYRNLFSPQSEFFLERIERCGVEIPPMTWKRTDTPPKCREIFRAAGLVDVETHQKDIGYYLSKPEQWWDILWNAGYRGLISQLSEDEIDMFKQDHLSEVKTLCDKQGLWLQIEVIYTIGIRN